MSWNTKYFLKEMLFIQDSSLLQSCFPLNLWIYSTYIQWFFFSEQDVRLSLQANMFNDEGKYFHESQPISLYLEMVVYFPPSPFLLV